MTATPVPDADGLARIDPPPGLSPGDLAGRLSDLPDEIAGLRRRRVQAGDGNATAVYLANETSPRPEFGMIVVLTVLPAMDAEAMVAALQRQRWGDPADHTVTASSPGGETAPAFREFWRTFPPGLFALPNQPVYFLIFYRVSREYAFMVIASTPAIRAGLIGALGDLFAPDAGGEDNQRIENLAEGGSRG